MGHPRNNRLPVISDFLENNGEEQTKILPDSDNQQKPKNKERAMLSVRDLIVDIQGKKNIVDREARYKNASWTRSADIDQGSIMGLVGKAAAVKQRSAGRSCN